MGGMAEDIQNNPWAVFYLGCQSPSLPKNQCFRCGGAIIAPRWVITAASCNHAVSASESGIVYGTNDIITATGKTVPVSNWMDVLSIIKHAQYDARQRNYDIAAVSTASAFAFGANVYPVCLPSADVCLKSGTQVEVMRLSGQKYMIHQVFTSCDLYFHFSRAMETPMATRNIKNTRQFYK